MKKQVKNHFDQAVLTNNTTTIIGMDLFSTSRGNDLWINLQFKVVNEFSCEVQFSLNGEVNSYLFSLDAEIKSLLYIIDYSLEENANASNHELHKIFSHCNENKLSNLKCNSTLYAFLALAEQGFINILCDHGNCCAIFRVNPSVSNIFIELNGKVLTLSDLILWINKLGQKMLPKELDINLHKQIISSAFDQIINKNKYNCTDWSKAEMEQLNEIICYLNHLDQFNTAA